MRDSPNDAKKSRCMENVWMAKDKARKHTTLTKACGGDGCAHGASLNYYSSAFTLHPHSIQLDSIHSIRLPDALLQNQRRIFQQTAAPSAISSSTSSTARPRCYQLVHCLCLSLSLCIFFPSVCFLCFNPIVYCNFTLKTGYSRWERILSLLTFQTQQQQQ